MIYSYIHVSTREQNGDRQVIALREVGVQGKAIYMDKQSGKDYRRPKYKKLLHKLRKDDLLYIRSIDRLGRNYGESWNNGVSTPKQRALILWCWICFCWTPAGART